MPRVPRWLPVCVAAFPLALVPSGCASILGISEQTFDGNDAGEGGQLPDQAAGETSADSTGGDDGDDVVGHASEGGVTDVTQDGASSSPEASPVDAVADEVSTRDVSTVDVSTGADTGTGDDSCGACTDPPNDCYESPGSCQTVGVCVYMPKPANTACTYQGGTLCNGFGACH